MQNMHSCFMVLSKGELPHLFSFLGALYVDINVVIWFWITEGFGKKI